MPTTDLDEQIWKDEMERFAEDTLAMWKTQYRYWYRASTQGAPAELLNEMASINELFKEAHERLVKVSVCFPEAEK